jgi:o-succinylbenzoate synthase
MRAELQSLHASIPATRNARRQWHSRHAVRLYLSDGSGHIGIGEAAPLPGFSAETAADAREALARFDWPDDPPTHAAQIARIVARIDPAVPSARFAAETALAALATSKLGVPLYMLWTDRVDEVPIATGLFGVDDRAIVEAAREAAAYGAHAVKLKIGRSAALDGWLVETVRTLLPHAELRLDANGTIDPLSLGERLHALRAYSPAYVEEPCALADMLAAEAPPVPFAIDESLAGADGDEALARALACDHICAVVLKPTRLGGLMRCWSMAQKARAAGRRTIISHLMEGPIARAACAHLALAIGPETAGLGEHPALGPLSDGFTTPWIDDAWIAPPELPGLGLELAF